MTTEREFLGIWIPKNVLRQGLPFTLAWVQDTYKIDLNSENPLQEEK